MKNSFIFEKFREHKNDIFCLISTGSYFSDKNITGTGWKDVDIIVSLNNVTLDKQRKISRIAKQLNENPKIDISLDIVSKDNLIKPFDILDLHTKALNAIYEANKYPSRILYFGKPENIYQLKHEDVKKYTNTAIRELYQEAHKDISRNLDTILIEESPKLLKRYIKRIFNLVKMSIINKTYEIPLTRKDIIKIGRETFDYDFTFIESLLDIIKSWPLIDYDSYEELFTTIIKEIYNFNKFLKENH